LSGAVLDGKTVLLTGGTGSLGQCLVERILSRYRPGALVVFSRDEHKQWEMRRAFPPDKCPSLVFVIGDIRDAEALDRALAGVDVVVHAAALKHVPTGEVQPLEFIKTNIFGAANLIASARAHGIDRVVALSTDKAVSPTSLYGATKMCADRLFISASEGLNGRRTRFSVVRLGNVIGSRGSVVPYFARSHRSGALTITDPRMTRFWVTLSQAADLVLSCLVEMRGGEIMVPKLPSMRVVDVARALAPDSALEITTMRRGERLHEVLISAEEACRAQEYADRFVILPSSYPGEINGRPCSEGFQYRSDCNDRWLSIEELQTLVGEFV